MVEAKRFVNMTNYATPEYASLLEISFENDYSRLTYATNMNELKMLMREIFSRGRVDVLSGRQLRQRDCSDACS